MAARPASRGSIINPTQLCCSLLRTPHCFPVALDPALPDPSLPWGLFLPFSSCTEHHTRHVLQQSRLRVISESCTASHALVTRCMSSCIWNAPSPQSRMRVLTDLPTLVLGFVSSKTSLLSYPLSSVLSYLVVRSRLLQLGHICVGLPCWTPMTSKARTTSYPSPRSQH